MATKICDYCRIEYSPPDRYTQTSRFCSKRCSGKATAEKLFPAPSPRPCAHCGKEYTPSRKHTRTSIFCSQKCSGFNQRKSIEKICEHCGSRFTVIMARSETAKFCSKECDLMARSRPKRNRDISPEELKELLTLDANTGTLSWRERHNKTRFEKRWNKKFAGKPAGMKSTNGYLQLRIYNQHYAAHRVVWAIFYGEWPSKDIDHKNGVTDDNRISNLRLAEDFENLRNQKTRTDNKSGHKGVCWKTKEQKWYAYIQVDGKQKNLGRFVNIADAIIARNKAEFAYFGEFSRIYSELSIQREEEASLGV